MKVTVHIQERSGDCSTLDVDYLALPAFEDGEASATARALDEALGGALLSTAKDEGFKGRGDQSFATHPFGKVKARKIALLGLGKSAKLDRAGLREYGTRVVRAAAKGKRVALVVPALEGLPSDAALASTIESLAAGAVLGGYKFDRYRTADKDQPKSAPKEVLLAFEGAPSAPLKALQAAAARGVAVAESVLLARDLVNEPPITLTPTALAEEARRVAKAGRLTCEILGPKEMKKLGMGLLLGVAAGSAQEPRLVHLTYTPAKGKKGAPVVAFVGKGLTFDSGGLSLKPPKGMEDMKCDMAGAAAVLGAMKAIGALRPEGIVVHGFIGTTENMPGGRAIRPGDILKSMNGKTVEVLNTDAEGRLVLADVIEYAKTKKVGELVDLATLTGACMVALGRATAGFFANNDEIGARYGTAAKTACEEAWRLPLVDKMVEDLRSPVADLKNIGGPYGGAITGALFLREFVGDVPWVHVDIAGPAFNEGKGPTAGGTGYGVMTLVQYALSRAAG